VTNGAEDQATQERNERLTTLRARTEEWADREIERLEYEKEYLESVLSGRVPGGQLEQHIRTFTSSLVQDEIDGFLETE
jgi:hypothetical protein